VAPDGGLAAYCICWYDPISRSGEFEPVGARPTYRRQGYGRAVVIEGLRRLRALGAETAIVFSHGGETPANRLYAACGFREEARTYDFRASPPTSATAGA
jgi:ribosomal protein S18 acetylase RimI-like enzyme